jgi:hypothetical protein
MATDDNAAGPEHDGAAPVLIEKAGETARKALDMDPSTEAHRRLYAEGVAEGWAEALVMVLKQRYFATSDELLLLVLKHTDPATLERWLRRVVSAPSVSEIFA